ncbi:hypothetical protein [Cellulomonas sp. URHE0023]|uniref:hypothetical protein n=1 Tax=Cellulomonas sp. URHE0023 TaxID=1380354 RepID=UPI0004864524|nr:hypothetical protein [Cellulomonas sp. URHE0023]
MRFTSLRVASNGGAQRSASDARRAPVRARRPSVLTTVLLALLVPVTVVLLGGPALGGPPAGLVQGTASQEPLPQTTDYDDKVGGPHQDTPAEQTGRAVTPARLALMVTVAVVTLGIIATLAVRSRRQRLARERDPS